MKKEKKVAIGAHVPASLRDEAMRISAEKHVPFAQVLRQLVRDWVASEKQKNKKTSQS